DNGIEGIILAKNHKPDLIICDIVMRETDGYTVFEILLKDAHIQNIPFIFSTANSENTDREKAKKMGCRGYLVKPFDGQELLDCVNSILIQHK
ncbi:MAG: response regulator, partial [Mucilaginibacter sp.]